MPSPCIINAGRGPRRAAEALAKVVQPGDVVLIKGRNTQMLDRVRLILEGRRVGCDVRFCNVRMLQCTHCPMLEEGWDAHRIIMREAEPGQAPQPLKIRP